MNTRKFIAWPRLPLSLGLAVLFPGLLAPQFCAADERHVPRKMYQPAADEFETAGRAVTNLLQSRDTARFAKEMTATADDWKAVASTNVPGSADNLKNFTDGVARERQQAEASAKAFLAKADSLHLDFSKGDLHARVINPKSLGNVHYPTLLSEDENIPYADKVEIVLNPDAATNTPAAGEFKVALRRLMKFPAGWRVGGGIQWESFPANVADEKTRRELVILEKASSHTGLTGKDDPALLRLGDVLVRFLRAGDTNIYAKEALAGSDQYWTMLQARGQKGPSRAELDKHINEQTREQTGVAVALFEQNAAAGIDLKDADIQVLKADIGHLQSSGMSTSAEGLMGEGFKLKLAVKTDAKSKTGASLSGNYVLAVNQLMRFGDDWKVMQGFRWDQVPAGVLDAKAAEALKLEGYVAEHRSLPPGSAAPEIEFTSLDGEKKMKLSDLRGKVVVLDFWATWCGPCQQPMAELQKLRQAHAGWGDKVAIVPLSIDDTEGIVRKHVDKRGWTNTFNVWAGDGGWASAPAKAFRVTGVPTTYIIDAQGKIVTAGHPASMDIGEKVEASLGGKSE